MLMRGRMHSARLSCQQQLPVPCCSSCSNPAQAAIPALGTKPAAKGKCASGFYSALLASGSLDHLVPLACLTSGFHLSQEERREFSLL